MLNQPSGSRCASGHPSSSATAPASTGPATSSAGLPTTSFLEATGTWSSTTSGLFLHDDASAGGSLGVRPPPRLAVRHAEHPARGRGSSHGEDVAEQWFAILGSGRSRRQAGDAAALTEALESAPSATRPCLRAPPGSRAAIATLAEGRRPDATRPAVCAATARGVDRGGAGPTRGRRPAGRRAPHGRRPRPPLNAPPRVRGLPAETVNGMVMPWLHCA